MRGDQDRELYRYTDTSGDIFAIRRPAGTFPLALVDCDPEGSHPNVELPPHEVPRAARALYEAAGLPVPGLPDIPDPALVRDLAETIHFAMHGTRHAGTAEQQMARVLIAHGFGRTQPPGRILTPAEVEADLASRSHL